MTAIAGDRSLDVESAARRVNAGKGRPRDLATTERPESVLDSVDAVVNRQQVGDIAADEEQRHIRRV